MTRARAQRDQRFADRLSPLIAALGVTAVPNLLLRYQGRLELTSNEVIYLQHVLLHRWEEAWPWVAVGAIVEATGAAERSVRDWKASLIAKGLLTIRSRGRTGGGRGADEHDLSPLFARLEALAIEEEVEHAADQVRKQLPSPTYYRDWSSVPTLARQGARKLQTQRVQAHSRRAAPGTTDQPDTPSKPAEIRRFASRANLPVSAAINLPEPAREKEASYKKPVTPQPPVRGRGDFFEDDGRRRRRRRRRAHTDAAVSSAAAEDLVDGLYRGLGVGSETSTARMRRTELAIARHLVDVGATPDETEAYAREMNVPGRHTAVSMASFEKDRPSWLARRTTATVVAASSFGVPPVDPWEGRRPPIAEIDLARARAVGI